MFNFLIIIFLAINFIFFHLYVVNLYFVDIFSFTQFNSSFAQFSTAKPLLPPYKPAVTKTSTESYANVTPVSPGMKPNEEFIAAPKPTAINSYPMKPKTCNPTVPMKPNILQNKNTPMLPANGMSNSDASRVNNLHTENGKINVSHNAQNKTSNNIPAPLYTSVEKSYLSHSSKVCSAKDIDFRNPVPKGKIFLLLNFKIIFIFILVILLVFIYIY